MRAGIRKILLMVKELGAMASRFRCDAVRVDTVFSPCVPNGSSPGGWLIKISKRLRSVLTLFAF
jgi:hypothetical protein